jgi:hypothetical protein
LLPVRSGLRLLSLLLLRLLSRSRLMLLLRLLRPAGLTLYL